MTTKKAGVRAGRAAGKSVGGDPALAHALEVIAALGKGDFSVEVDLSKEPGGGILSALRDMRAGLLDTLDEVRASTDLVHRSSQTMNTTVKALRDHASKVQGETQTVADSTTEMSSNMNTVSSASEELSVSMKAISDSARQSDENIEVISAGTKELTTASQEIAKSTERAAEISKRALENVTEATKLVSDLEIAAREIGVVTSTISEISDQTKLLALNATIEAARAGEAGRGFAVVAKEVKELASQTNTATKDIQQKIAIIQGVTDRTIAAIDSISRVMGEVDSVITTIAAAAEEQSATTKDIAANIVDTTDRIRDMSNSVKEGALAVQDVNKSIAGIAGLSGSLAGAIGGVRDGSTAIKADATISYAHVLEVAGLGDELKDQLTRLVLPPAARAGLEPVLCRFTRRFSVSIASMDDDHGGIKRKETLAKLASTTRELALFTRDHFEREEKLMASESYPGLPEQERAHRALLGKVQGYLGLMEEGKEVDLIEVMVFLKGWLQSHILGMDRNYAPYLNARGVR